MVRRMRGDKWKNGLFSRRLTRIIFVVYVRATLSFVLQLLYNHQFAFLTHWYRTTEWSSIILNKHSVPHMIVNFGHIFLPQLAFCTVCYHSNMVHVGRYNTHGPLTPSPETPCFDKTVRGRQIQCYYKTTLLLMTDTT